MQVQYPMLFDQNLLSYLRCQIEGFYFNFKTSCPLRIDRYYRIYFCEQLPEVIPDGAGNKHRALYINIEVSDKYPILQ